MLQLLPRLEFEAAFGQHQAERHARGFRCWSQFVAMLFCQLGHAQTLREITGGLAACEGKLRHLGVDLPPKRSTLAYANQHRPWQLFQTVVERFYQHCRAEAAHQGWRKFRFQHKVLSLDATMIPLWLSVFDWALCRRSKGAVKLHLVLDHDGWLPQFAVVTAGKTAEIEVARRQRFEPGAMLEIERHHMNMPLGRSNCGESNSRARGRKRHYPNPLPKFRRRLSEPVVRVGSAARDRKVCLGRRGRGSGQRSGFISTPPAAKSADVSCHGPGRQF